jgi:hypothetical protein
MCGIGFLFGRQVAKCHQKEAKSQLKWLKMYAKKLKKLFKYYVGAVRSF